MLTDAQKTEFDTRGHVRLPGVFDRAAIAAITDRVWRFLATHRGVRRDDPRTWAIEAPWAGVKAVKQEDVFRSLDSPALRAAIDALLGAGAWTRPGHWGGFLISFPDCPPDQWTLPDRGWHVDFHFTYDPSAAFGVRVFTFLSEVGPRGGGTLVVSGSHRLVTRYVAAMTPDQRQEGYAVLRDRFNASHPWLAELTAGDPGDPRRTARYLDRDHELDGVRLRVESLCGSPGDAILAHPWLVHVTSSNAGTGPRFMLAKNIYRDEPA